MVDYILKENSIIFITAPPKSGKSTLIRELIYNNKDLFQYGLVFTSTGKFNGDYDFIPKRFVHSSFNENILKHFLNIQIQTKRKNRAFLIFDDFLGCFNPKSKFMTKLLSTYRHYNISIIISTQHIKSLPPIFRECTSYSIIFNTKNKNSIQSINENFMTDMDEKQIYNYIQKHCIKYHFILIDMNNNENDRYSIWKVNKSNNYEVLKFNL